MRNRSNFSKGVTAFEKRCAIGFSSAKLVKRTAIHSKGTRAPDLAADRSRGTKGFDERQRRRNRLEHLRRVAYLSKSSGASETKQRKARKGPEHVRKRELSMWERDANNWKGMGWLEQKGRLERDENASSGTNHSKGNF